MIRRLWHDESGSVVSCEIILLTTVLVIGVTVGAKSFRDSAVTEWADYAQAIANFDQSYDISGTGVTTSSRFEDQRDFCDTADADGPTSTTNEKFCTIYGVPPTGE